MKAQADAFAMLYKPKGQLLQVSDAEGLDVPAGQALQDGAPARLNAPAAQGRHALEVALPVLGLNVPAVQGVQEGAPCKAL